MSLKWSHVWWNVANFFVFSLQSTHNTSWSAPHSHMPPPNLPKLPLPDLATSNTKIKLVIAGWIATPHYGGWWV